MGRYLDTTGRSTLAIGICDRCRVKMSLDDLASDVNAPGVRACRDCRDLFDPYRLPARKTERITVRHPRPDAPLYDVSGGLGSDSSWVNGDGDDVFWVNYLGELVAWSPA